MAGNEVEIKFLVEEVRALQQKLRRLHFREVTPPTREFNTLLDTRSQELRKRGELLRIRKYGKSWILTHKSKGKAGRHKARRETETAIADGEKLMAILRSLGFSPWFQYEKFRSEWTDGRGKVVIDKTPIGKVAEIEGKPRWIDATAKGLALDRSQYITKTYIEMFWEWRARTRSKATNMTFREIRDKRLK